MSKRKLASDENSTRLVDLGALVNVVQANHIACIVCVRGEQLLVLIADLCRVFFVVCHNIDFDLAPLVVIQACAGLEPLFRVYQRLVLSNKLVYKLYRPLSLTIHTSLSRNLNGIECVRLGVRWK